MKTVNVSLGGREYTISELPTRKNAAWRAQLAEKLSPITDLIERAPTLNIPTSVADLQADPAALGSIAGIVKQLSTLLLGGVDEVLELVIAYSPALEKDRAWIGDNVYDSELLAAFVAVLGLAYPFGPILRSLQAMDRPSNGSHVQAIGQS